MTEPVGLTREPVTFGGPVGVGAAGVPTVIVHNPNAVDVLFWVIDTFVVPPA